MRGFAASRRLPSMPSNFRQRYYSYTPGNFWRGFVRASSFSSHRMCARSRVLPTASDGLNETSNGNEIMTHFRVNRRVYGVRKLWHALRRAVWSWPARLMRNAGISGVVCAAATPRPRPSVVIDRRRGIRICMTGRGTTPPRVGTSGGWPTSPTCGCWRSSGYVAFADRRVLPAHLRGDR